MLNYQVYSSPVGLLYLVENQGVLIRVLYAVAWKEFCHNNSAERPVRRSSELLERTKQQLEQYFAGERQTFELELCPSGSSFQQRAWSALQQIPYGQRWTYGTQAAAIGAPKAHRAVGSANRLNPYCVIVPCHRVVAQDGKLAGYAGGLKAKQLLLELETRWTN